MQYFASESNRVRNTTAYRVLSKKCVAALPDIFEQSSGEAFQAFKLKELSAEVHNEGIIGTGLQGLLAQLLLLCRTKREGEGERKGDGEMR